MSDEKPVEEEKELSYIFPCEIKYEAPDGTITSIYLKEGALQFRYKTDDEGEKVDDIMTIVIGVGNFSKNAVIQTYPRA